MKPIKKPGAIPPPNAQFLEGAFHPNVYICRRATHPPLIDGDLDKPFWAAAEKTQPFNDIEGDIRPKPRKETWAKLLWDDTHLYLGARLYDDQIWATVTQRDAVIFHDNDFEFFLDRDGSTHGYVEMEINALNTLWDLLLPKPYRDGGGAVDGFDLHGVVTAVTIAGELNNPAADNQYWSVEMMIPWAAFPDNDKISPVPKPGDYYRFNLSRVEWKAEVKNGRYEKVINPATGRPYPEDNWVYAPTGLINIHYPELWAFLVFAGEDGKGQSPEDFVIPEIEKIKWDLRKLYYAERAYCAQHGTFTPDINALGLRPDYDITIETTPSMYQAYVKTETVTVNMAQDGYTWIEEA